MIKKNNNFLLQKDDVGMPKPTVRDLPQFGHAYGLPGARDSEGVKHRKSIHYQTNYWIIFLNLLILIKTCSNYHLDGA